MSIKMSVNMSTSCNASFAKNNKAKLFLNQTALSQLLSRGHAGENSKFQNAVFSK